MRKYFVMLLAFCLCLILLSVPVIAEEEKDNIAIEEPVAEEIDAEESVAEEITDEESNGENEVTDNPVVNIVIPQNLDFTLDPSGIAGHGQIYSKEYEFRNYSDTDVILKIVDYKVIFANNEDFIALPHEVNMGFGDSPHKAIQILLNIDDKQLILTDDKAETLEIFLPAGEAVLAGIGGSLNPYPIKDWRSDDVKINVNYQIEVAGQVETTELEVVSDESEPTTETKTGESSETTEESSETISESSEATEESSGTISESSEATEESSGTTSESSEATEESSETIESSGETVEESSQISEEMSENKQPDIIESP